MSHDDTVLGLLELAASEQPGLLADLGEIVRAHPACEFVCYAQPIAAAWGIPPPRVCKTARRAVVDLDRLEKLGGRWRAEDARVRNVRAVVDLAKARAARTTPTRALRLGRLRRKLADLAEHQRIRQWILAFVAGKTPERPLALDPPASSRSGRHRGLRREDT